MNALAASRVRRIVPLLGALLVITIEGMQFKPAALTVRRGDRITWVNKDLFPHSVTGPNGAFDSKSIPAGGSWSLVAGAAGTYAYTCTFHPTMKATLTVR